MNANIHPRVQEELLLCQRSFLHFCRWLKIVDKSEGDGASNSPRVVPLRPNFAQLKWLEAVERNPWTYTLKSRKEGLSTIIAARYFWRAFLNPEHKVLVVSEIDETAMEIFEIYRRYWRNLPEVFREAIPSIQEDKHTLKWVHEGEVTCRSQGSSFRGGTRQSLHFSEFAFYPDIDTVIGSAFDVAADYAEVALETTSAGINRAHQLWVDEGPYEKVFIPWNINPGNTLDEYECSMQVDLRRRFDAWCDDHALSEGQRNWARMKLMTKCGGQWLQFMRNYPLTDDEAFMSTGDKFFPCSFPHAEAGAGYEVFADMIVDEEGHERANRFRSYTMGVDTASGSTEDDTDFCAVAVLDVTNAKDIKTAATWYGRWSPTEFADLVLAEAEKWQALVVVESNSYGLNVLDHLVQERYPFIFTNPNMSTRGKRHTQKLGWWTGAGTRGRLLGKMHEAISRGWFVPECPRLKKEINSFIYNEHGSPQHAGGKHDDMIFATALAIMGIEQTGHVVDIKEREDPRGFEEIIRFEIATGRTYRGEGAALRTVVDHAAGPPPSWSHS